MQIASFLIFSESSFLNIQIPQQKNYNTILVTDVGFFFLLIEWCISIHLLLPFVYSEYADKYKILN